MANDSTTPVVHTPQSLMDDFGIHPTTFFGDEERSTMVDSTDRSRALAKDPKEAMRNFVANRTRALKVGGIDNLQSNRDVWMGGYRKTLERKQEELRQNLDEAFGSWMYESDVRTTPGTRLLEAPDPTAPLDPDRETLRVTGEIQQEDANRMIRAANIGDTLEGPAQLATAVPRGVAEGGAKIVDGVVGFSASLLTYLTESIDSALPGNEYADAAHKAMMETASEWSYLQKLIPFEEAARGQGAVAGVLQKGSEWLSHAYFTFRLGEKLLGSIGSVPLAAPGPVKAAATYVNAYLSEQFPTLYAGLLRPAMERSTAWAVGTGVSGAPAGAGHVSEAVKQQALEEFKRMSSVDRAEILKMLEENARFKANIRRDPAGALSQQNAARVGLEWTYAAIFDMTLSAMLRQAVPAEEVARAPGGAPGMPPAGLSLAAARGARGAAREARLEVPGGPGGTIRVPPDAPPPLPPGPEGAVVEAPKVIPEVPTPEVATVLEQAKSQLDEALQEVRAAGQRALERSPMLRAAAKRPTPEAPAPEPAGVIEITPTDIRVVPPGITPTVAAIADADVALAKNARSTLGKLVQAKDPAAIDTAEFLNNDYAKIAYTRLRARYVAEGKSTAVTKLDETWAAIESQLKVPQKDAGDLLETLWKRVDAMKTPKGRKMSKRGRQGAISAGLLEAMAVPVSVGAVSILSGQPVKTQDDLFKLGTQIFVGTLMWYGITRGARMFLEPFDRTLSDVKRLIIRDFDDVRAVLRVGISRESAKSNPQMVSDFAGSINRITQMMAKIRNMPDSLARYTWGRVQMALGGIEASVARGAQIEMSPLQTRAVIQQNPRISLTEDPTSFVSPVMYNVHIRSRGMTLARNPQALAAIQNDTPTTVTYMSQLTGRPQNDILRAFRDPEAEASAWLAMRKIGELHARSAASPQAAVEAAPELAALGSYLRGDTAALQRVYDAREAIRGWSPDMRSTLEDIYNSTSVLNYLHFLQTAPLLNSAQQLNVARYAHMFTSMGTAGLAGVGNFIHMLAVETAGGFAGATVGKLRKLFGAGGPTQYGYSDVWQGFYGSVTDFWKVCTVGWEAAKTGLRRWSVDVDEAVSGRAVSPASSDYLAQLVGARPDSWVYPALKALGSTMLVGHRMLTAFDDAAASLNVNAMANRWANQQITRNGLPMGITRAEMLQHYTMEFMTTPELLNPALKRSSMITGANSEFGTSLGQKTVALLRHPVVGTVAPVYKYTLNTLKLLKEDMLTNPLRVARQAILEGNVNAPEVQDVVGRAAVGWGLAGLGMMMQNYGYISVPNKELRGTQKALGMLTGTYITLPGMRKIPLVLLGPMGLALFAGATFSDAWSRNLPNETDGDLVRGGAMLTACLTAGYEMISENQLFSAGEILFDSKGNLMSNLERLSANYASQFIPAVRRDLRTVYQTWSQGNTNAAMCLDFYERIWGQGSVPNQNLVGEPTGALDGSAAGLVLRATKGTDHPLYVEMNKIGLDDSSFVSKRDSIAPGVILNPEDLKFVREKTAELVRENFQAEVLDSTEYDELPNDEARRKYITDYVLDPAIAEAHMQLEVEAPHVEEYLATKEIVEDVPEVDERAQALGIVQDPERDILRKRLKVLERDKFRLLYSGGKVRRNR